MPRIVRSLLPAALALLAACYSTGTPELVESYIQTTDGALLHYRKLGDGPEVVVVLNEAWTSPDLDRLARGRTLYYYDLRNRGRSGKAGSVRMEKDFEDLEQVLDWFGLQQVTLVGHDYQAALAALFAARHPERVERLVLVSPLPPRKFPYWNIYERVYGERVDAQAFEKLRTLQREDARRLDPEAWAAAYKDVVLSGMVVDMNLLRGMKATPLVAPNLDPAPLHRQYNALLAALGDWDWREEIAKVSCPALVVSGADDPVPAESTAEWAATLPAGELHTIPRASRLPWIERSSEFFSAVGGFLDARR